MRSAVGRAALILLGCSLAVVAIASALGGTQARGGVHHVCSAADRQFLSTAASNLVQLRFWSQQLSSGDATRQLVRHQSLAEAGQVAATRPLDSTLLGVRGLLAGMLAEYGNSLGGTAGAAHLHRSWRLAGEARALLLDARPELLAAGCDPTPLLVAN